MGCSGGESVQRSSIISDCSGSSAGAATSGCGCGMDTGIDGLLLIHKSLRFTAKSKIMEASEGNGDNGNCDGKNR